MFTVIDKNFPKLTSLKIAIYFAIFEYFLDTTLLITSHNLPKTLSLIFASGFGLLLMRHEQVPWSSALTGSKPSENMSVSRCKRVLDLQTDVPWKCKTFSNQFQPTIKNVMLNQKSGEIDQIFHLNFCLRVGSKMSPYSNYVHVIMLTPFLKVPCLLKGI